MTALRFRRDSSNVTPLLWLLLLLLLLALSGCSFYKEWVVLQCDHGVVNLSVANEMNLGLNM